MRQPLPPNTGVQFFRLLFPEEDVRRKYDIQETRLAQLLAGVLGVATDGPDARGFRLVNWAGQVPEVGNSTRGCLGHEIEQVLKATETVRSNPLFSL